MTFPNPKSKIQNPESPIRLATFVWAIDPLFLQPFSAGIEARYLVGQGTPEEAWARAFLDPRQILSYRLHADCPCPFSGLNTELALRHTDMGNLFDAGHVNALLITNKCTPDILEWATRRHVPLVSTPYPTQRALEDKLFFHRFLADHGLPEPQSAVYRFPGSLPISGRKVIQDPESSSAEGTFFVDGTQDIEGLVQAGSLHRGQDYLVRKFVAGKPFGITVFIASNVIALSALRLQCFQKTEDQRSRLFTGIHWMAAERLSSAARGRIEEAFMRIGRLLHGQGFLGYANFDFILDSRDEIHIIECNPRPGSATAQILAFPQLISGLPIGNIFAEECLMPTPTLAEPVLHGFPDTVFEGSCFEINVCPHPGPVTLSGMKRPRNGLYRLRARGPEFLTPDIREIDAAGQQFIFYSGAAEGETFAEKTMIGYIYSNFPIYRLNGTLNKRGQALLNSMAMDFCET